MTVTPTPAIDVLPPNPRRLQDTREQFVAKMDAHLAAQPNYRTQLLAVASAAEANAGAAEDAAERAEAAQGISEDAAFAVLQGAGLIRRVSNNLSVGTGAKDLTGLDVPVDASFANGMQVALVAAADRSVQQWGLVSLADMAAGTMRVTIGAGDFTGAGPLADWFVVPAWFVGLVPATAGDVLAVATSLRGITPLSIKLALTPYALTDGTTVTPNGFLGKDFTWTIGGNRTLAAITNTYPGARGSITITQDGTGGRVLATSSVYKRKGGLGVLPVAAGAIAELVYNVKTVDGSGTATRIVYQLVDPI